MAVFVPNLIDQPQSAHLTSPANICVSLFFLCRRLDLISSCTRKNTSLSMIASWVFSTRNHSLSGFLLVLERDSGLLVMYAVSYVDFVFQYRLDLRYRPCVTLALRRIGEDVGECSVSLVVYPRGSGYFFFNQRLCDFRPAVALISKENIFSTIHLVSSSGIIFPLISGCFL